MDAGPLPEVGDFQQNRSASGSFMPEPLRLSFTAATFNVFASWHRCAVEFSIKSDYLDNTERKYLNKLTNKLRQQDASNKHKIFFEKVGLNSRLKSRYPSPEAD